ncbi:hypothetical protein EC973_000918 [Apophysomyces ossiformis]|uniref:Lysosomal dipeptide transporter MFSD1 n=1 Tax=Apophysomyces ossiformis TaxID=679940 RepID=A0A8H7ENX0_9FUNG|nr:hypothetical protein EC973_000918 [Apophysomyces ossiformis]
MAYENKDEVDEKASTVEDNSDDGKHEQVSWKLKSLVLLCMLAIPVGCHYMEATVGTLKTALKQSMHINNTQFSILLSAVTLVNTVLPLLAGTFVDDTAGFGSIRFTTVISLLIFVGSLMVSFAASYNCYPLMVGGQIAIGLGSGMIVTTQEGILAQWFRDSEIAIIIGVMLCIARLTKFIAKLVCYPIVHATGSSNSPIYIATLLCAVAVAMNGLYWLVMYRAGRATATGKELGSRKTLRSVSVSEETFRWTPKLLLYLPALFWMVPWMQLIMSSILSSFDDIATEYVQFRFGATSTLAGYQSSLTQVVPIVIAPLMGVVVHRFGKRLTCLIAGALVLILALVLLAYTWVTPAAGMIIFSLALALGPVGLLSSTPLLLPHELAGTGMGLHKCANNVGTTIVSVLVGYVQDLTYHDGNTADDQSDLRTEYEGVMILYLVLALGSLAGACIFWFLDRRWSNGFLEADKEEREHRLTLVKEAQEKQRQEEQRMNGDIPLLNRVGNQLRSTKSYLFVGIFGFWFLVSWAVFFTFALMPIYEGYGDVS